MDLRELLNLDKKLIFLENINGDKIGVLNDMHDVVFSPRFNSISTLSFRVYEDECLYYEQITSWRRIQIQDVMKLIIEKPLESNDGLRKYKEITCRSLEIDINRKVVPLLQGTYKFYSVLPSDETICSIIMDYLPNWSIESVDSELWNIYRTFDLQNRPLYQMMMEDIENAFECIFEFDTLNQRITIKAFENIPKKSDIYLSFDNLVNELNITEDTENLITSISVSGANGLDIRTVNPLSDTIYNFQHFATTEYMSQDLVTAIDNWQTLINTKQVEYSDYLLQRKTKLAERIDLEVELVELQGQLRSLIEVRDALLDSGLNATDANTQVKVKQTEINNKEIAIDNKQTEIDNVDLALQDIQNLVSLKSYFSQQQLLELEPFIINISVTDENFTKTDISTDLEIQETAQDLYDKYKKYLDKASKMRYKFSIDLINFISIQEYKLFTQQLDWGVTVNLETESNGIAYPMLLGLDINLDDETDIQFLFGEDLRYEDKFMSYEDYISNQLSNVSNMVTGSSISWGEYINSGAKDRVWDLFKNGLNADLQEIKNADNQELLINKQGLLARKQESNGSYSPEQLKIIHNKLVFTDNNFDSLKTAVGKVTLPDLTTAYGINAEVVMGKLIAGNQLVITNSSGTFQVDANGVLIKDLNLRIVHEDGSNNSFADEIQNVKDETSTNLSNAIETINGNIIDMQEVIEDGMIVTYYQVEEPTGKLGDLWFNTATKKLKRYNGATWELIEDKDITTAIELAQDAQTTADGKIVTYYQEEQPINASSGDLWIDVNDNNKLYRFDGEDWIDVHDKNIDEVATDLSNAISDVNQNISDMQQAIEDSMIVTYYQNEEPIAKLGDLWFDTDDKKLYRHNGITFDLVEDKDITTAIEKAQNAQDTADGKIVTYYANQVSDTNISPNVAGVTFGNGDIWFNTTGGKNTTYRYNGIAWILIKDKEITDNTTNLNNLTTKIGNAFKQNGVLDASKLDGIIDTTHTYMTAVNNQVLFDSTGMWSMNNANKNLATEAVWLNERGILLGVRTTTGAWLPSNFSTAITAHGINADYITSGQINAISFIGGSINVGNGKFTVDSSGNLVAKSGTFTGTITASNFNQGTIEGSTINIGEGNFTVDEDGNVTSNGNFNLLGNIRMGGNITWDNPVVLYQYSTNNSSWHNNFIEGDKYRRESWDGGTTWQTGYQFVGIDGINGINGSDANVNDVNVFNALTNGGKFQGIFSDGSGKLYMNAQYIRSGTLSGVTINVDTNATVGNNIYLGELSSNIAKTVYFNNTARIVGGDGMYGGDMTIIANSLNLENINVINWGSNMPIATAKFA